ncbi:signal peptidase I [Sphingosinicellaceae bacterium]|nr:signal peptidase I [Sphingosinicellaceae bacterium]
MTDTVMATKPAEKKTNWAHEAWQLFLLALVVLGIHSLVAKPFYIPSGSMESTLLVGDQLIVSKFPYGYSYLSPSIPFVGPVLPEMQGRLFAHLPQRADIVVVKSPVTHDDWIKRVIGLPGDTVEMRNGVLWLNGAAVPKRPEAPAEMIVSPNTPCDGPSSQYLTVRPDGVSVCRVPRFRETIDGRSYDVLDLGHTEQDDYPATIVPEGHIFLMGDNRDNSEDSRFPSNVGLGMLPIENLVGRAEFITYSVDGSWSLDPRTWFSALRGGRAFSSLHPSAGK